MKLSLFLISIAFGSVIGAEDVPAPTSKPAAAATAGEGKPEKQGEDNIQSKIYPKRRIIDANNDGMLQASEIEACESPIHRATMWSWDINADGLVDASELDAGTHTKAEVRTLTGAEHRAILRQHLDEFEARGEGDPVKRRAGIKMHREAIDAWEAEEAAKAKAVSE